MESVKHYLTKFDFTASLLGSISRDSQTNSPLSSNSVQIISDLSDLTDLSDSSCYPTPSPSPLFSSRSLPEDVDSPTSSMPGHFRPNDMESMQFEAVMRAEECEPRGLSSSNLQPVDNNPPMSRLEKMKACQYARNREWRKKKRTEQKQGIDSQHIPRMAPRTKYVEAAVPIQTNLEPANSKVTTGGYTGGDKQGSKRASTLGEVMCKGFRLVKWDGSTPHTILDKSRRIIGVLAGHPPTDDWPSVHAEAAEAMKAQRTRLYLTKKIRKHRRGAFPAIACGVSHGGGQRRPSNLDLDPPNQSALEYLNKLLPFKRIAGFASSIMAYYTPDLHKYYTSTIKALHSNDPSLLRPFPSGIFSAASYNFGPRTTCYKHRDFANLPFGLCAITALGTFDPTKGGHLVLWDLKLVIEFPPGSTILIPSAIIAHSNTPIGKEECRYSFTQYTAGALFRWVDNQCNNQEIYLSTLTPEELVTVNANNEARWKFGLSLLPTVADHVDVLEL